MSMSHVGNLRYPLFSRFTLPGLILTYISTHTGQRSSLRVTYAPNLTSKWISKPRERLLIIVKCGLLDVTTPQKLLFVVIYEWNEILIGSAKR